MFELVGKIIGDGSHWASTLDQATRQAEDAINTLKEAGLDMNASVNRATIALEVAIKSVAESLISLANQSLDAWMETEDTLVSLQSVITSNGGSVADLTRMYQEFASEMQEVTTLGDDTVLTILQQAEAFGVSGAAAKKAAQDAIAIASINNANAESMIRITAKMAEGDIKGAMVFSRMIPQLRGVRDEMEFVEKYEKLVAAGMLDATAATQTMSGALAQLSNDWGDVQEDIGRFVAEGLKPMVQHVREVVKWIKEWDEDTKRLVFILGELVVIMAVGSGLLMGLSALVTALGAVTLGAKLALIPLSTLAAIGTIAISLTFLFNEETLEDIKWLVGLKNEAEAAKSSETTDQIQIRGGTPPVPILPLNGLANNIEPLTGQIGNFFARQFRLSAAPQQEFRAVEDVLASKIDEFFNPSQERLKSSMIAIPALDAIMEMGKVDLQSFQRDQFLGALNRGGSPTPFDFGPALGGEDWRQQMRDLGMEFDEARTLKFDKGDKLDKEVARSFEGAQEGEDMTVVGRFRSNLQEEERQFLALQAGRRGGPEEQTAQGVQQLVNVNQEMLAIQRDARDNGGQLMAANF